MRALRFSSQTLPACALALMPVRVMHVGEMRMLVSQRGMPMPMRVRFPRRVVGTVVMLVVFVVTVGVFVIHRLMGVHVFVALRQVQVDAQAH